MHVQTHTYYNFQYLVSIYLSTIFHMNETSFFALSRDSNFFHPNKQAH